MDIHKECRISQYMFHIQKIIGPLSPDQLDGFKDISDLQETKISAADAHRLAVEVRSKNWNNNRAKQFQNVSYNTWLSPWKHEDSHETETEKLLKATTILKELIPKYFCENHTDPVQHGKKETARNGNTIDVTKLKQVMKRAVERLSESSIVNVEEFMRLCLEELDDENDQAEHLDQAWDSHRNVTKEKEKYDEEFEVRMTSVIAATINACRRRLRKIESNQRKVQETILTVKPNVNHLKPKAMGDTVVNSKMPIIVKEAKTSIEFHEDQMNKLEVVKETKETQTSDKTRIANHEKLQRTYKKKTTSDWSYPSRFSYYLPESAVPKNWAKKTNSEDDLIDDHYHRERLVVPRLDLSFTKYEDKIDVSHHSTYSSYWSKSLSSEGSFREWLRKKGVNDFAKEQDKEKQKPRTNDEKKPKSSNNANNKIFGERTQKSTETSSTETDETFSVDGSLISLFNRQMDRTEIWVESTLSKTEIMRKYGSDVLDSSENSDQSAVSSYTTDWTPVSQRMTNGSDSSDCQYWALEYAEQKASRQQQSNDDKLWPEKHHSKQNEELVLKDIEEEQSYSCPVKEAFSWSDISIFSRNGNTVPAHVSKAIIPDGRSDEPHVVKQTCSDISIFYRDGFAPTKNESEISTPWVKFQDGNFGVTKFGSCMQADVVPNSNDIELPNQNRIASTFQTQNTHIAVNDVFSSSSNSSLKPKTPTKPHRIIYQEEETYESCSSPDIPTLVTMYANSTTELDVQNDSYHAYKADDGQHTRFTDDVQNCAGEDLKSDITWKDEIPLMAYNLEQKSPVIKGKPDAVDKISNTTVRSGDSHVALHSIKAEAGEEVDTLSVPSSYGSWSSNGREYDEFREFYRDEAYKNGEYIVPEDLPKQFLPGPNELRQIQAGIEIKCETKGRKETMAPDSHPGKRKQQDMMTKSFSVDSLKTLSPATQIQKEETNLSQKRIADTQYLGQMSIGSNSGVKLVFDKVEKRELKVEQDGLNVETNTRQISSKSSMEVKTKKNIKRAEQKHVDQSMSVEPSTSGVSYKSDSGNLHVVTNIQRKQPKEDEQNMKVKSFIGQVSKKSETKEARMFDEIERNEPMLGARVTKHKSLTSQISTKSTSTESRVFNRVEVMHDGSDTKIASLASQISDQSEIDESPKISDTRSNERGYSGNMKIESLTSQISVKSDETKSFEKIVTQAKVQHDLKVESLTDLTLKNNFVMETGSASRGLSPLSEKAEALQNEEKTHCDLSTGHVINISPTKTNDNKGNELPWDSEENVEQNKDIRSTAGNDTELNKESDADSPWDSDEDEIVDPKDDMKDNNVVDTESPWDSDGSDDENKNQSKVEDVFKGDGKDREESDVESAWDSDENDNDGPQYAGNVHQNEESNNEEIDAESARNSDESGKEKPSNVENDLGNTKNDKTNENEAEINKTEADDKIFRNKTSVHTESTRENDNIAKPNADEVRYEQNSDNSSSGWDSESDDDSDDSRGGNDYTQKNKLTHVPVEKSVNGAAAKHETETVSKESRSLIDEDNSIQSKGDNPIFDGDLSVGTPRFFRLQREKEQLNKAQNEKSQKNNKKHEAVVSPVKSDSDISSETTGSWQIKTPVKREAGPDTRKSKSNDDTKAEDKHNTKPCDSSHAKEKQRTTQVLYNGALVIKDGGSGDDTSDDCSVIDMPPDELEKWKARHIPQYDYDGNHELEEAMYYNDMIENNLTSSGGDLAMAKAQFLAAVADACYVEPIESLSAYPYSNQQENRLPQPKPFQSLPEMTRIKPKDQIQIHGMGENVAVPLKKRSLAPIQTRGQDLQQQLRALDPSELMPLQKPGKLTPLQPLNDVLTQPLQRQGILKPLAPINLASPRKKVKTQKKKATKSKKKEKKVKQKEKIKQKEIVTEPKNSSSTETFSVPSCNEAELAEMLRMDGRTDYRMKESPNKMFRTGMDHPSDVRGVNRYMADDFVRDDYDAYLESNYRSSTRTVGRMDDDFIMNSYDSSDSDIPRRNVNYNSKKNDDIRVNMNEVVGHIRKRQSPLPSDLLSPLIKDDGGSSNGFTEKLHKLNGNDTEEKNASPIKSKWIPEYRTWESLNLVPGPKCQLFQPMHESHIEDPKAFKSQKFDLNHGSKSFHKSHLSKCVKDTCSGSLGSLRLVQANGCPKIELQHNY